MSRKDGNETAGIDGENRRRFLKALGVLGVAGLAGCGGDGGGTASPTGTATPTMGDDTPTGTATPTRGGDTPRDTTTPTMGGDTPTGTDTSTPTDTATPTRTPREPTFVSLFDGGSLEDAYWHQVNGTAEYTVENGAIVGTSVVGSPNSFLSTYKMFDDFVLEMEVNLTPDGLNSGIQVRSNTSQSKQHLHGPQVEIELSGSPQFGAPESGYVYGEALGTGWLSQDRTGHDAFINDGWNDYRIKCEGNRIQTFVNDEQIADLDLSPYSDVEHLLPMGTVGLQVHSTSNPDRWVKWRNIRIKELDVQEWTRLFNGRNTNGWTNPMNRGTASASDGVLELSGDQSFFLLSEDSYDDFVFETWVKAGAKGGIMFRNPGQNRVSGYRAEIDPTDDALSGSLYDHSDGSWLKNVSGEPHSQMAFKPDQWNYYRVMADGGNLRVWVNGITTANVTDDSQTSGMFGLQHRGGEGTIQFREMEYKPLGDGGGMN